MQKAQQRHGTSLANMQVALASKTSDDLFKGMNYPKSLPYNDSYFTKIPPV